MTRIDLLRRLPLMVTSVVFAFFLWFLIMGEEKVEAVFMVPVVFDDLPPSVMVDGPSLGSVYVRVRGNHNAVKNVLPQQIQARADLSQGIPGNNVVQVNPRDITLPRDISLLSVSPQFLEVKLSAKRSVPITVRTVGAPAEGYEVTSVTSLPLQVEVVGPEKVVAAVPQVFTYPVDISGLSASAYFRARLVPPKDEVRLFELRPTDVTVEVAERQITKILTAHPVESEKEGVSFSPARVRVELRGSYSRMKELTAEEVHVGVDWTTASEDDTRRPLRVTAPEGVALVSLRPEEVTLK